MYISENTTNFDYSKRHIHQSPGPLQPVQLTNNFTPCLSDQQSEFFMSSENHFPIAARPFGMDFNNGGDCCGDSAFKSPSLNRKIGGPTQFKNTSSEKQYLKQNYLPQSGRKFGENILNIGENSFDGGFSLYRCATDKKDSERNSTITSNKGGGSLQTSSF